MKKFEEVVHEELQKSEVFFEEYNGNFIPSDEKGVLLRKNGRLILFPWLKFASDWVSPEDYATGIVKWKDENRRLRTLLDAAGESYKELLDINKKLRGDLGDAQGKLRGSEDYIKELKSQLEKQQPEIPEFMAKAVEEFKKQPDSYKGFSKVNEVWSWLNEYQMNNDDFGICGLNNKFFVLAHFAINGYTVAKEKRFYLKNKLTKRYLRHAECNTVDELLYFDELSQFTQQEIDSMETGSYEQIEVVK